MFRNPKIVRWPGHNAASLPVTEHATQLLPRVGAAQERPVDAVSPFLNLAHVLRALQDEALLCLHRGRRTWHMRGKQVPCLYVFALFKLLGFYYTHGSVLCAPPPCPVPGWDMIHIIKSVHLKYFWLWLLFNRFDKTHEKLYLIYAWRKQHISVHCDHSYWLASFYQCSVQFRVHKLDQDEKKDLHFLRTKQRLAVLFSYLFLISYCR